MRRRNTGSVTRLVVVLAASFAAYLELGTPRLRAGFGPVYLPIVSRLASGTGVVDPAATATPSAT